MTLPDLFKIAKQISFNSDHNDFRHGAAIYKQGKLLSHASNNAKSHPKMKRYGSYVTRHAEWNAISKIKNKDLLKGATIVIYRETWDGKIAMSKPCEMCFPMIREYGIKKVIYTTDNNYEVIEL